MSPFRRVAVGALALALVAWCSSAASAQTIAVTTRTSLADGTAVPGLQVRAELLDGQSVTFSEPAVTDAAGVARWAAVPLAPERVLRVAAVYEGVEYFSAPVTADSVDVDLPVTVHPVSADGRPLHLDTLHLIVQAEEPGVYRVLQFMTVSNAAETGYAGGPALADGRRAGIVIPIPEAATAIRSAPFPSAAQAIDLAVAELGSDRILDPRPVSPLGRQVAITYDLVAGADDVAVLLKLPYPTASATLLLGGAVAEAVEITDTNLQARPAEQVGDQQYRMWAADTLQPGTELSFRLRPNRHGLSAPMWALIGLAAALLLAVAASVFAGRPRNRGQLRQSIIADIGALDDRFAGGQIEEGDYFTLRGAAIEKLMLLQPDTPDEAA